MRKAGSCLFSLMMVCFLCYLSGCNLMNNLPSKNANASNQNSALSPKGTATINGLFTPPQGKTMLILGQDLKSTWDYISTSSFPTPAGITTYLNLYSLDGLGPNDTDWGAGPINAASCVNGYPNSVLVMGIYMTEQYYPGGLTDIANGKYDTQIKTLATFIKSANRPAYIRIGYEFEGQWNGFTNPATYIAAYKHIVDTIRPVAPNFVSVWQAAASPIDTVLRGYHPNITDWYPGDNYVDWCGLSFFLPQDSRQFTYADEMLNFARSHQKPVMICESTPQGYNLSNMTKANISPVYDGTAGQNSQAKTADQIWSEWYAPYFNYIHQNADAIRAVAYINADWNSQSQWSPPYSQGYWGDTRVQENATIKQNWITEINSAFWLHGSSGLFSQLQNSQTTSSASTSAVSSSSKSSSSVSGGSGAGGPGQSFAPGNGKTLSLIGQNYLPEYQGYISGTGITPAGCSIYGEIYTGLLDTDSVSLLSWLQSNYPNAYVELAISVKDNPGAGGYGDFTTTPNAVYNAEVDIANGKWNTQIDIFANIIKAHPGMKFMVRLDYEVSMMMAANKTTTPYINILNKYNALGINIQTDPGAASELDCNAYKNMFNYMANRIRNTDGCANANFIYHPVRGYADCVNLYPGDTYCDWIGFSIFNNDICMNTLNSDGSVTANGSGPIDSNLSNCMAWAGPKKPIIICESAFQETGNGQSWTDFQTYLNKVFYVINTFGIQAFVYINSAWQSHSWTLPWGDSQVQDNAGVKSTWLSQISGSRYINYNGSIISPVSSSSSSSISSSSAASSSLAGVIQTGSGVNAVDSTSIQIWTVPTAACQAVQLHYGMDGQSINQNNYYMTQSGTTWLKTLSGLLPGDFVQYYFTYGWSAGGQNDSPVYTYFFNSSSSTSKSSSSSSIAATSSSSAQISSVKSISSSSSSMMPSSSSSSSSPATTGGIKIQMFNGTTALQSNTLNPQFQLVNSGSSIINLSQIKIRYYFTADGSQPINFWCDNAGGTLHGVYTSITSQVVGTIMKKSPTTATADTYLELSFNTGSISLYPGDSLNIQTRMSKNDWSNFNQNNDYSFNLSASTYSDWQKAPAYLNGALQWGVEP